MKKVIIVIITIIILAIIVGISTSQNQTEIDNVVENTSSTPENSDPSSQSISVNSQSSTECLGDARCFTGTLTKIIDGDTIHVNDQSVRFALASAPELKGYGGTDARDFIQTICPVGSEVLVDEDDGQILGSYDRMVGMVTCNDMILNKELIDANLGHFEDRFCSSSEFANLSWAIKYGCITDKEVKSDVTVQENQGTDSKCDKSYPDFCIPQSPPDLNCKDITEKRFTVLPPDPHNFDADEDGIGCES